MSFTGPDADYDVRVHLNRHEGRFVEIRDDDIFALEEKFIELSLVDGTSLRIDLPRQQRTILISLDEVDVVPFDGPFRLDDDNRAISKPITLWKAIEV